MEHIEIMENFFDIIILGGGHAGLEAAYASAQYKNLKVAIVTLPGVGIASAPCNPAIGGVGKGQVVREIDALGGIMGKLADRSGIQFRVLNESKGFAVQSTRVQIDKDTYSELAEEELLSINNLKIIKEKVISVSKKDEVFSLRTNCSTWNSKKLIVTVGTFLNGKLHVGQETSLGGRIDAESSGGLKDLFFNIKKRPSRFKTGTPARLIKSSIDYSVLVEQPSDNSVLNFHYSHGLIDRFLPQVSCFLAETTSETISVIANNKEKSPMYNGQINAVGARYCPSIEDKVMRYPDKHKHHVFIEPEGHKRDTVYPSGVSSSLPKSVQKEFIRSIPGLESAEIETYGYAVEYDVVDTTSLKSTLEYAEIEGLYFAGQVNGTSGYEEAAGQGLVAGLNAALSLNEMEEFVISRRDSYIGVMIQDLISNTRDEPYRLFTARSENRLYIREDNAIIRMMPYRKRLDLSLDIDRYSNNFFDNYGLLSKLLDSTYISPRDEFLVGQNIIVPHRTSISEVLKQSKINPINTLLAYFKHLGLSYPVSLVRCLAISKKYEGYIAKADEQYRKVSKLDKIKLDWENLVASSNISFECKQRIKKIKPETFEQLKLIDGIRPATLAVVANHNI